MDRWTSSTSSAHLPADTSFANASFASVMSCRRDGSVSMRSRATSRTSRPTTSTMPGSRVRGVLRRVALRIGVLPSFRDVVELETFCSGTGRRWAERRTTLPRRRGALRRCRRAVGLRRRLGPSGTARGLVLRPLRQRSERAAREWPAPPPTTGDRGVTSALDLAPQRPRCPRPREQRDRVGRGRGRDLQGRPLLGSTHRRGRDGVQGPARRR